MTNGPARYKQNRLQQLRGFYYAARAESMSKAAERMMLSQPSVSLQIKALERELGVRLFDRRGPQIKLTDDGRTLLEVARPLVEGIDRLEQTFAARRSTADRGTVTIAAGGSTLQYILPPFVERFAHDYPRVDVRLRNVTGKAGLSLLRAGDVDLAVGPMFGTSPDILFYPLFTFEPILITCRDHPLAQRKRVTLRDISRFPLVLPPRDQSTCRFVEAVFAEHALEPDVKLEVGGYDVIKQYVRLNLGVSIVLSHCLSQEDDLHMLPVPRYFPRRDYGIVLIKDRTLSPPVERFVRTLHPAWRPGSVPVRRRRSTGE